jgi:hypothetical protein
MATSADLVTMNPRLCVHALHKQTRCFMQTRRCSEKMDISERRDLRSTARNIGRILIRRPEKRE